MAATYWRRALAATVLSAASAATALAAPGDTAEILDIQGRAEQRPNATDAWAAARIQQVLSGGAFVRTLQASKLALLFADETQVRLNQNTVLEIKPPAGARDVTTLRLELGRAWTQARRVPQGLNVETPAATAAIRGTDWELEVAPDGRTTLVVLSGSVDFFNAQAALTVGRNEAAVAGSRPHAARHYGTCRMPGRVAAIPRPSRHPSTSSISASPGSQPTTARRPGAPPAITHDRRAPQRARVTRAMRVNAPTATPNHSHLPAGRPRQPPDNLIPSRFVRLEFLFAIRIRYSLADSLVESGSRLALALFRSRTSGL